MCNRYTPPRDQWDELGYTPDWTDKSDPRQLHHEPVRAIGPRGRGAFMRKPEGHANGIEQIAGTWGLIPHFESTKQIAYSTNICRAEEVEAKPAFRMPWRRGQRCIIPADEFWEPCWETYSNVWWNFTRANGRPFALAGLWDAWVDPVTGEVVESYTMFTVNADAHPLMGRMHKPDLKLPPDQQDKRTVCVLEPEDWEDWLCNPSPAEAKKRLRCAPAEIFVGTPETPAGPVTMGLF